MKRKVIELTGDQIVAVLNHVEKRGLPKLRRKRLSDRFEVDALPLVDGTYDLGDATLLEYELHGTDLLTFARHCDVDVWRLVRLLRRRGYTSALPSCGTSPTGWPPFDVDMAVKCLLGRIVMTKARRLRDLLPRKVHCRDSAHLRPFPHLVREAIAWLGAKHPFPLPSRARVPQDPFAMSIAEPPSAVALSFLQLALDQVDAKVRLRRFGEDDLVRHWQAPILANPATGAGR